MGAIGREVVAKKVCYISIRIDFMPLGYKRQGFIPYLIQADYPVSGYDIEGSWTCGTKKS
jgi:hypothetical protein